MPSIGLPSLYTEVYNLHLLAATVCISLSKPIIPVALASRSKQERFGQAIYLISKAKYKFVGLEEDSIKRLYTLKSYYRYKLYIQKGNFFYKTIDFAIYPGIIFLAYKSLEQLDQDKQTIRDIFSCYLRIN